MLLNGIIFILYSTWRTNVHASPAEGLLLHRKAEET